MTHIILCLATLALWGSVHAANNTANPAPAAAEAKRPEDPEKAEIRRQEQWIQNMKCEEGSYHHRPGNPCDDYEQANGVISTCFTNFEAAQKVHKNCRKRLRNKHKKKHEFWKKQYGFDMTKIIKENGEFDAVEFAAELAKSPIRPKE